MDFETQEFTQKNFSLHIFEGDSYVDCTFKGCQFNEADLGGAAFSNCRFENCNLSLVKVAACRFHQITFLETKFVGVQFYTCEKKFFTLNAIGCILDNCNFSDLKMKRARFDRSKIKECYYLRSDLTEASFAEADLAGTIFHECNLARADFRGAINYNVDPKANQIKKAKFTMPEAMALLSHFDIVLEDGVGHG